MESKNQRKSITASEAKTLSSAPSRLANIIFRNIEEEAQLGRNCLTYTSPMSEQAQNYIEQILAEAGYKVESGFFMDPYQIKQCEPNTYDKFFPIRVATLIISWDI